MRRKLVLVALTDPAAQLFLLNKAVTVARKTDASLLLFHCTYDPIVEKMAAMSPKGAIQGRDELIGADVAKLEAVAGRLRRKGLEVTTEVRWAHPPFAAIVHAVVRTGADLVVAGTHAHGFAARFALGYNDWQLLRLCPCPVLLVKSVKPYRNPVVLAAVDPGHLSDKPATLDAAILRHAADWVLALQGRLHVTHAYLPLTPMGAGRFGGMVPHDVFAAHRAAAVRAFSLAADQAGVAKARRHFVEGSASHVLPKVADATGAKILVMGVVSRGRLKRALIGSTAERIADRLRCDLLAIKPAGFEPPASQIRV
jgi:universal stress protein E